MTYLGSPEAVLLVDEEVIAKCKVVDCDMIKILSPGRGLYTIFGMTQEDASRLCFRLGTNTLLQNQQVLTTSVSSIVLHFVRTLHQISSFRRCCGANDARQNETSS